MYSVVVPRQCENRGLPVKRDRSELNSHLEMRRSKENRNHLSCLKYIVPVYRLIYSHFLLKYTYLALILIFVSTFVCNCRINSVFNFLLLASPALEGRL